MSDSLPVKSCPECGTPLPPDAPEDQCPRCLMAQIIEPTQAGERALPMPILTAEELAPYFPQYEIQGILGRGGMGAVYLARQISLNRLVAIKILPADLGACDLGFAERFKNEAHAMAQLSHPGIVAVFDFGETASGLLYIVMEFIDGTDVQQMVAQQGRLHSAHAMAVTAHVCDALAYAHSRGIIHRDIKPSNIMVSSDGVVKVADFGLAKMSQGEHTASHTQSGVTMGTLHFMAPEALTLGTAVDQRADIYAVGVMLYQMLTGKLPQGMFEMPSLQVPGLDPRYDGIVAKALREDRAVRYQQASELRHDLDAILTQPVVKLESEAEQAPAAVPPPTSKPQRPAGQHYRPPQRSAPPPPKKKLSTDLIPAGLGLLAVIAAVIFFLSGKGGTTPLAAHATKEAPFVNTLGMKFVPVPITGGPTAGKTVLFSMWETRVQDYTVFAAEKQHEWAKPNFAQEPLHPVVNISWDEAQAFCSWLTEREHTAGKLGTEDRYRLPSDHEWSCAVGIGDREDSAKLPSEKSEKLPDVSPWGSAWPPPPGTGNYAGEELQAKVAARTYPFIKGVLSGYRDEYVETAPVGSFPADGLGLYDLSGNAREWCEDGWDTSKRDRVLRGGSWGNEIPSRLLSSHRDHFGPSRRYIAYGFRVVLETAAPANAVAVTDKRLDQQPAKANASQPIVNSLGMKFVPIPESKVLMCIHETRKRDYAAYAAANAGVNSPWSQITGIEEHPVVDVSWTQAEAFCAWLGKKEGVVCRLPTDREWSQAAGIAQMEDPAALPEVSHHQVPGYSWGSSWPPPARSGNFADLSHRAQTNKKVIIEGYDDGYSETAPVMSYAANSLGIHDIGGNVTEWVGGWYDAAQTKRASRDSCWNDATRVDFLLSKRRPLAPDDHSNKLGFRCVIESDSQPAPVPAQNAPQQ